MEVDGKYAAVPIDGRGPVVHYRTDWFEEAGLAPPRTYDEMLAAAAALHDPDNQRYGIGLSTDPGNEAMQTRLESMALANGCNLVDSAGEADFDSPNCLEFLEFEQKLRQYAPEGLFDSVASRALYLSGQAAMYIGGTATLHRMAGLDDSQLATCDECTENPAYLAENTALIPAWSGPSGEPVQLGALITVGISADANVEPAQEFVRYLLTDGYTEWLAQAPNILLPARPGTEEDPEHFLKDWRKLEMGVERRGLLDDFYEAEVVDELLEGAPKKFDFVGAASAGADRSDLRVAARAAGRRRDARGRAHAAGSRRAHQRGAQHPDRGSRRIALSRTGTTSMSAACLVVPVRSA